jgi:hypothetical protein
MSLASELRELEAAWREFIYQLLKSVGVVWLVEYLTRRFSRDEPGNEPQSQRSLGGTEGT